MYHLFVNVLDSWHWIRDCKNAADAVYWMTEYSRFYDDVQFTAW